MAGQKISFRVKGTIVMLTDSMMDGSGNGGLMSIYFLSAKRRHINRAISWAIYQVNTMKYVAAMELQNQDHCFIITSYFVVCLSAIKFDHNDCQQWR